ncbi:MAG: class I SAM-dependent methyltransferase [archaeon]
MKTERIFDEKKEVYSGRKEFELIKFISPGQKVLDVGCADGTLGQKIKSEFGNVIVGIEVSKKMGKEARKKLDAVVIGDVEEINLNLKKNYFDVVVLADILEHLKQPEGVIKKLNPFLKSDGTIIVSVPNVANIFVRLKLLFGKFDYEKSGIMDETHLRWFTLKSLKEMMERNGFKVEKTEGIRNVLALKKLQAFFDYFKLLKPYEAIDKFLANKWKSLFAQQFILVCEKKEKN